MTHLTITPFPSEQVKQAAIEAQSMHVNLARTDAERHAELARLQHMLATPIMAANGCQPGCQPTTLAP